MIPRIQCSKKWLVGAAGLSVAHFATFDILHQPLITDIRFYVYFAWRVANGSVPYRDFFDIKTPLASITGAGLIHAGSALGLDPLIAVRIGYLAIAACIPVLYAALHRTMEHRGHISSILCVVAFCGFPLLGYLPSIGNIPKQLMALFAVAAALFVARRLFFLAGIASALAFFDWQIGVLVCAAVFVGACCETEQRARAVVLIGLGQVLGAAPFVLYFAGHSALGIAARQTLFAARARGESALMSGLGERISHLGRVIDVGCDGQEWLVAAAAVGLLVLPIWLWRYARERQFPTLMTLGFYHYGVIGYSLFDFQLYGDLFILVHSLGFFLGVALLEFHRAILGSLRLLVRGGQPSKNLRAGASLVVLVLALAAVRPSIFRQEYSLATPISDARTTLDDQLQVSDALRPYVEGKNLAFVQYAEQLFLSQERNGIPYVTWARGDYFDQRRSPEESRPETWNRLLRETCPEVIACEGIVALDPRISRYFKRVALSSENHTYSVAFWVLADEGSATRYRTEFCVPK